MNSRLAESHTYHPPGINVPHFIYPLSFMVLHPQGIAGIVTPGYCGYCDPEIPLPVLFTPDVN